MDVVILLFSLVPDKNAVIFSTTMLGDAFSAMIGKENGSNDHYFYDLDVMSFMVATTNLLLVDETVMSWIARLAESDASFYKAAKGVPDR